MKIEIKNAIMKMLSDDATVTELCDTAEDFECPVCGLGKDAFEKED